MLSLEKSEWGIAMLQDGVPSLKLCALIWIKLQILIMFSTLLGTSCSATAEVFVHQMICSSKEITSTPELPQELRAVASFSARTGQLGPARIRGLHSSVGGFRRLQAQVDCGAKLDIRRVR